MYNLYKSRHLKYFTYNGKDESYLQIFYHNANQQKVFTTEQEFFYSNTDDKYSILVFINDEFKTNEDVYDFIIEYPDTKQYGHFTQKINPLYASYSEDVGVDIKTDSTWDIDVDFVGLHQSEIPELTFIEGVHTYDNGKPQWFVAIAEEVMKNDPLALVVVPEHAAKMRLEEHHFLYASPDY